MVYIQSAPSPHLASFATPRSIERLEVRPEADNIPFMTQGSQAASFPTISVSRRSQSPITEITHGHIQRRTRGRKIPCQRIAVLCWANRVAAGDMICSQETVGKSLGSCSPSHAMAVARSSTSRCSCRSSVAALMWRRLRSSSLPLLDRGSVSIFPDAFIPSISFSIGIEYGAVGLYIYNAST